MAEMEFEGLSEEERVELAQLAKEVALEETPSSNGDAHKEEPIPTYVQTVLDQSKFLAELNQSLTREFRTLQGTVDRMQAGLQQKPKEPTNDLADIDDSDPSIAALIKKVQSLEGELSQVKGVQHQSALSAQEQAQRDGWLAYLEQVIAIDLGVDFAEILPQLKNVPTADLAVQGAKLITAAFKKAKSAPADMATEVAKEVAKAKVALLKQFGVWEDVVQGAGSGSADDDQFLKDFAEGKSQDFTRMDKLLKGLR